MTKAPAQQPKGTTHRLHRVQHIATRIVGKRRIVGEIVAADGQHEAPEDGVTVGTDGDVLAIFRRMRIRRRDAGHDVACALTDETKDIKFRHQ